MLKPGYSISKGIGTVVSSKLKVERITFIPPKSNYYRSQFHLFPFIYYKFEMNSKYVEVNRNDKPKKKTKIYYQDFTKQNSPLVFRNFIAFSLTEDFKEEFYVDNEFYLSNMKEMDLRHFKFREKDEKGNYIYVRPYKKQTSFYLDIPKGGSIEDRIRYGE